MKRYLIFAVINPFLGGLLLLFATTFASGYWTHTNWAEVGKFVAAFVKTLQFAYLFGIVPALMMGAIDDILLHVRRIGPVVRMLIVGTIGFAAAANTAVTARILVNVVDFEVRPRNSILDAPQRFIFITLF